MIWLICALSIAGVLTRARGIPEWVYAVAGALALVAFGCITPPQTFAAISRGTDVYLFLSGMMLLAELARRQGVFNWIAAVAVRAARGSSRRLFALIYAVGIIVTVVLSNDATAVVLTPAVAAAVRRARIEPLPHLLACAFIANAASFVLPISNPANLVVFATAMPALPRWIAVFGLPSLLAIGATYAVLAYVSRRELRSGVSTDVSVSPLRSGGRLALGGVGVTAVALVIASALSAPLGLTTCIAAVVVFAVVTGRDRRLAGEVAGSVSWSVLALVAGLFVLVAGMERTGLLEQTRQGVAELARLPRPLAVFTAGGVTALASNALNNLPAGLIAGSSVGGSGHDALRNAVAVGIDLGPNLSVTGSLATVLWLLALRREKIEISAWSFLKTGALVMPPALVLALAGILVTSRS